MFPEGLYVVVLRLGPEIVDLSGSKTALGFGNTHTKGGGRSPPPTFFDGFREALRRFLTQNKHRFLAQVLKIRRKDPLCINARNTNPKSLGEELVPLCGGGGGARASCEE